MNDNRDTPEYGERLPRDQFPGNDEVQGTHTDSTDSVEADEALGVSPSIPTDVGHDSGLETGEVDEFDTETIEEILGQTDQAVQLPSLFDKFNRFTSMYAHKYNTEINDDAQLTFVDDVLRGLRGKTDTEFSSEEQQLVEDVKFLEQFTFGKVYTYVYTPSEIHELCESLQVLREPIRPNFGSLEENILIVLQGQKYARFDKSLVEVARRADNDSELRSGMQWRTLKSRASEATGRLDRTLLKSEDSTEYKIKIKEQGKEYKNKPDITEAYQFTADYFACNVLASRAVSTEMSNQEAFVANCSLIDEYMAENAELIDNIPSDFLLEIRIGSRRQVRKVNPKEHLNRLVSIMHEKLTAKPGLSGLKKSYLENTSGALKFQYMIAHITNNINEQLDPELSGQAITHVDEDLTEAVSEVTHY